MKIRSDFYIDMEENKTQMGWLKMQVHSLTEGGTYGSAEIQWLPWLPLYTKQ